MGTLLNGKVFHSSYDRGAPAQFPLSGVIRGGNEGVPLTTVGSKYKFWIPSDLACGPRGRPPVIPPNSLLAFEIELLDVVPAEGKPKADEEEDADLDLKVKKKVGKSWCWVEFAGSPGEQLPCPVPFAARWS